MSGIRNRIEGGFERLAHLICDHPYRTLFIILVIVASLASQLPKIKVDTTMEGFLHEDDPSLVEYEAFKDQFGRDQMIIIALSPPKVFDLDFLNNLNKLHNDLKENVPHLEDISSLINARNTYGEDDELIVDDLLENWPKTPEELAAIKKRALNNPMYKNLLISEDCKFTAIVIETATYSPKETDVLEGFDDFSAGESLDDTVDPDATSQEFLTDEENSEAIEAVAAIIKNHNIPNTQVYVSGSPALSHYMKKWMLTDMNNFMMIAVSTIILFLFIIFRRISGVLLPLLVVLLSLVSTIGLMAATGTPLKMQTQILPSFLLAVGVGASVHILAIFYRYLDTHHDKEGAIVHAMGHSGFAVLMTSVTTASGLLSFSTAEVAPIGDLGKFAAAGIMMGLLFTIILLPAFLAIFPIKPFGDDKKGNKPIESKTDALLTAISNISIRHPYLILTISTMVIIVAIFGTLKNRFYHNPLEWLPETSAIRIAGEKIDEELRGSATLEVVVDTGKENGLYDPDILNRLDESAKDMEAIESGELYIGKAWSITTILKEINRALHNNNDDFYTIPSDKQLIAQEFLLFENSGSDDLEDMTDSQFSKARLTMKVPFIDFVLFADVLDEIHAYFKKKFPDARLTLTGIVAIFVKVETNAMKTLARSYVYALIIITVLMIVLIGRIKIGLLSMIPNITPILITTGGMGLFGIHMGLFNMLVGSIAIGLAVDDTIHFMHNFRRYFEESGDAEKAVTQTLLTTGRAMVITTCVLSLGFFSFMLANMNNLICFGMLTGVTIILALLSDFFLAPALMIAVNRKRNTKASH